MAVYVDTDPDLFLDPDPRINHGKPRPMYRLFADYVGEMVKVRSLIGAHGYVDEHYNLIYIRAKRRKLALGYNVIVVTNRQADAMLRRRERLGYMGRPEYAEQWFRRELEELTLRLALEQPRMSPLRMR